MIDHVKVLLAAINQHIGMVNICLFPLANTVTEGTIAIHTLLVAVLVEEFFVFVNAPIFLWLLGELGLDPCRRIRYFLC